MFSGAPGAAFMNGLNTNVCGLLSAGEKGPRPGERKPMGIKGGVDYGPRQYQSLHHVELLTGYAWNVNPGI